MLIDPALLTEIKNVVLSPAFITALAALIAAGASFFFNSRNLKNEIDKMENERDKWLTDAKSQLRSHYLDAIVQERLKRYAPVFRILGEVRDVPDPKGEHWSELRKHPEKLQRVANELLTHLYGEAGLVMDMDTRSQLLTVYYSCYKFSADEIDLKRVIDDFYKARRKLRADLQIQDNGERTELSDIIRSYGGDTSGTETEIAKILGSYGEI